MKIFFENGVILKLITKNKRIFKKVIYINKVY